MAKYLLLLHESPATGAPLTPADIQEMIESYSEWAKKLRASGNMHLGMKLGDNGGFHLRNEQGAVRVTDGPYAEAKDVVGGFYVIEAANDAEAQALASGCPHVHVGWIEIRNVEIG
jgi:hypothetical protein